MQLSRRQDRGQPPERRKSTGPKTPRASNARGPTPSSMASARRSSGSRTPRRSGPGPARSTPTSNDPADRMLRWVAGGPGRGPRPPDQRCQASEMAAAEGRVVARAEVTWDKDRRLEATLLGGALAARPEVVSARLLETYHGCEWLLRRRALLAHAADARGACDPGREARWPSTSSGPPGGSAKEPGRDRGRRPRDGPRLGRTPARRRTGPDRPADRAKESLESLELDARPRRGRAADHADPELRRLRRYGRPSSVAWNGHSSCSRRASTPRRSPDRGPSRGRTRRRGPRADGPRPGGGRSGRVARVQGGRARGRTGGGRGPRRSWQGRGPEGGQRRKLVSSATEPTGGSSRGCGLARRPEGVQAPPRARTAWRRCEASRGTFVRKGGRRGSQRGPLALISRGE